MMSPPRSSSPGVLGRARLLQVVWAGYAAGPALAILATGLTVLLRSTLHLTAPLLFLYVTAILIAAWWGYGPPILTSLVCVLLADYFIIPPTGSIHVADPQDIIVLLSFLVVSLLTSWLATMARTQWRQAEALSAQLARQNRQLADQNETLTLQAEQIAAQNEELAVQAEELEAQNEELAVQAQEMEAQNRELGTQNEELHQARRQAEAAESAAAARAAELEGVLAVMPDGVVITDARGRWRLINATMRQFLGAESKTLPEEMAEALAVLDVRRADGRPLTADDSAPAGALRGEMVVGREMVVRAPDGTRLLSTNAVALRGWDGELLGAVTTSRDVTEERQREQRLRTLATVVGELAAVTEPVRVLNQVVEAAGTLLDVPATAVFLLRPNAADFQVAASRGLRDVPEASAGVSPYLSAGRSIAGRAVREGRLIALADVAAERAQGTAFPPLAAGEVAALLGVPIAGDPEGPPVGVLEAYTNQPRPWTAEEQDLLSELANAAAIALRALRRLEREHVLAAIAARVAGNDDSDEALAAVTEQLAAVMGGWCSIALGTPEAVRLVAVSHPERRRRDAVMELIGAGPVPLEPGTSLSRAMSTGQTVISTVSEAELAAMATLDNLTGAVVRLLRPRPAHDVVIPLLVRGAPVGGLSAAHEAPARRFSGEDVAFLTQVAERVATAIGNARLYQETESERARLRAVLDAIADGVLIVNRSGQIVEISRGGEVLFGLDARATQSMSAEQMAGAFRAPSSSGSPVARADLPWEMALRGETVLNRTYTYQAQDERRVDVATSAAPIRRNGDVIGAVIVARDVSAERALERQKDEFVSVASHELKNPITTIKANVQLVLHRLERETSTADAAALAAGRERARASLSTVVSQVDRLIGLIDDMLDLTRIQSGQLTLNLEPVDLGVLVRRAVEAMRPASETHRLLLNGDDALLPVAADPGRIEQVLDNLLGNAIKYSPDGSDVQVLLRRTDNEAVVSIRDHGMGIPEPDRAHVFERFYRVSTATTRQVSGLGLGLYVSHSIVARHEGRLWLEDSGEDGSTFYLALPLRAQS